MYMYVGRGLCISLYSAFKICPFVMTVKLNLVEKRFTSLIKYAFTINNIKPEYKQECGQRQYSKSLTKRKGQDCNFVTSGSGSIVIVGGFSSVKCLMFWRSMTALYSDKYINCSTDNC